jgi:hypothetical protein
VGIDYAAVGAEGIQFDLRKNLCAVQGCVQRQRSVTFRQHEAVAQVIRRSQSLCDASEEQCFEDLYNGKG